MGNSRWSFPFVPPYDELQNGGSTIMQPNPAASLQRGCPVRPWSSLAALIRVTAGPLRSLGGRGTRRAGHTPPTDAVHRLFSDAVNVSRVPWPAGNLGSGQPGRSAALVRLQSSRRLPAPSSYSSSANATTRAAKGPMPARSFGAATAGNWSAAAKPPPPPAKAPTPPAPQPRIQRNTRDESAPAHSGRHPTRPATPAR